jgi:mono/diheme cytochrome c family protein
MHRLLIVVITAASALSAFGQQAVAAQDKQDKEDKPLPVTFSLTGSEMYKTWCATCHGAIGKGDGPTASELKTHPADLTRLAKKNGGKFPTEKVRNYIDGTAPVAAHGSREMPVWGTFFRQIGDDQAVTYRIVTLANYVESLQAK